MALKLEGWNLLFYVFDGLKAKSQCYWYDCLFSPSFFFLFLSLSLLSHKNSTHTNCSTKNDIMRQRAEGGSFVSKSTSFIELSKIYHENIIDLCDETLSTLWYFFAFCLSSKKRIWGGDGYYHLWVNEKQCQESILGSALRMFKIIIPMMMASIEMLHVALNKVLVEMILNNLSLRFFFKRVWKICQILKGEVKKIKNKINSND